MKTLIAYSTKYGTTERCANLLKEKIAGDVEHADIGKSSKFDIAPYDWVIVGGPIYIGRLKKETKKFCEKNLGLLTRQKSGCLFAISKKKKASSISWQRSSRLCCGRPQW